MLLVAVGSLAVDVKVTLGFTGADIPVFPGSDWAAGLDLEEPIGF